MNDDLISRQAAIKAVDDLQNCPNGYSDTYDKACIIGLLEELPSVQPEIIRCKDRKYNKARSDSGIVTCIRFYGVTDQNSFCSKAERK